MANYLYLVALKHVLEYCRMSAKIIRQDWDQSIARYCLPSFALYFYSGKNGQIIKRNLSAEAIAFLVKNVLYNKEPLEMQYQHFSDKAN